MKNDDFSPKKWIFLLLPLLLPVIMGAALLFGSSSLTLSQVFDGLTASGADKYTIIIRHIRLPRMLGGLLAGTGLSVSGVLLQSVTGNDLASPNIIGVNSGAGLAVIIFLYFFPMAATALPWAAFLGAFLAALLILWIANKIGLSKSTVILSGIAATSLFNAGISFISLLDTDVLASYNYFSIGGLSGVTLDKLLLPAILIFLSLALSLLFSKRISLLCLGDDLAASLGVRVKALRVFCLACACACAASVVSFAGLLGFVGLIVPHIARKLVGNHIPLLLPISALCGGSLVILADLLGRVLFAPTEIPVGIVMALIGSPFFVFLLLGRRRSHAASPRD